MKCSVRGVALAAALVSTSAGAAEDWIDDLVTHSRFVLGAALQNHPEYSGSDRRKTSLSPVLAYEYGWLRVSASGAGAILGFGQDARGPGASAAFIDRSDLKLGVGLRIDSGRKSSDSIDLTGFEDIKRSVRGRVYASYALDERWTLVGNVSQDLLNRRGGALASTDLAYRLPLSPTTQASFGAGVNWADTTRMRSYYGVSDAAAARSSLPVFRPDAGLLDVHAGAGLVTGFTPRWIGFANAGVARLVSEAAASPLTRSPTSASVAVGLAYRCCTP